MHRTFKLLEDHLASRPSGLLENDTLILANIVVAMAVRHAGQTVCGIKERKGVYPRVFAHFAKVADDERIGHSENLISSMSPLHTTLRNLRELPPPIEDPYARSETSPRGTQTCRAWPPAEYIRSGELRGRTRGGVDITAEHGERGTAGTMMWMGRGNNMSEHHIYN
ncbi:hypothetical protein EDC04DRAFT_2899504 [Pisolithus marmoratus]|nr:hypothetical protein EDC04DRAFT_2899504 [Pisolithus marmoratus]